MHLDLKVLSSCLMKPCVKKINVYYRFLFQGARSYKALVLSSQKGLIRSYFQLPKNLVDHVNAYFHNFANFKACQPVLDIM